MTKAVLIGATGLVGAAVVAKASGLSLVALARRAPEGAGNGSFRIAPAEKWAEIVSAEAPAVLINCLGTTIKAAGSEAAFRAVDHDLALAVAAAARAAGTAHMISISSVGASSASRNFYLRTKGNVEDALRALGLGRLDIIRPGLLMGERQGPPRPGEALAMRMSPLTDRLLHGPLRRYRSISADAVARAIIALAGSGAGAGGTFIYEHDAVRRLAD